MAYASISGRARTNPRNPSAFAVCDRCSIWHNHKDLQWQYDWRGATIQNVRILVCNTCLDVPQEQLRAIVVPPDPMPIMQPRTEYFVGDETNYRAISAPTVYDPITGIPIPGTTTLVTQDGQNLSTQPVGIPADIDINAIPPLKGTVHYGVALHPLSITANGTDQITVTFSSAHGLATNDQIVVEGLSSVWACGAFSITVTTATAFTYQTNNELPAASLLTGSTLMWTADIGLPYDFEQLPQVGGSGIPSPQVGPVTDNGILTENDYFLLQENGAFLLQG